MTYLWPIGALQRRSADDDLPPLARRSSPVPVIRWRIARVLLTMVGVQLAVVAGLVAIDAVEPTDAKELLTVVAVPLYPLLGSVVAFYFTARRFGFHDELIEQLPNLPVELDRLARRLERDIGATRSDLDRVSDIAKWTTGAVVAGLVVLSIWSMRRRAEAVR